MQLPPASDKVRQQAAKAIDEIRVRGWCQSKMVSNYRDWRTSRVCLMGAIRAAVSGHPSYPSRQANELIFQVGRRIPYGMLIDDWNDDPGTTVDDVCDLLSSVVDNHPYVIDD